MSLLKCVESHAHTHADLSIDVMDVSGEHQFDLLHSLYKQRLDDRGNPIIDATVEKYQFEEKAQGGEGGEGGGGEERENIQESKDTKIAEQCQRSVFLW